MAKRSAEAEEAARQDAYDKILYEVVEEGQDAFVDIWLLAYNADTGPEAAEEALAQIQERAEEALPNVRDFITFQDDEPEEEESHSIERRPNGIFTDALRYTAGRIDKRKERKRQERVARRVLKAKASR